MLNIVPISELTGMPSGPQMRSDCPICHDHFPSEEAKGVHLDIYHPNWPVTLMFGYLRQVPRENG